MHRFLLLAARHEQVLGQAPVEKGADAADADDAQVGAFADPGLRDFRGRDDPVLGIVAEENLDPVANLPAGVDVAFRQQHLAELFGVEKQSDTALPGNDQLIETTEIRHGRNCTPAPWRKAALDGIGGAGRAPGPGLRDTVRLPPGGPR